MEGPSRAAPDIPDESRGRVRAAEANAPDTRRNVRGSRLSLSTMARRRCFGVLARSTAPGRFSTAGSGQHRVRSVELAPAPSAISSRSRRTDIDQIRQTPFHRSRTKTKCKPYADSMGPAQLPRPHAGAGGELFAERAPDIAARTPHLVLRQHGGVAEVFRRGAARRGTELGEQLAGVRSGRVPRRAGLTKTWRNAMRGSVRNSEHGSEPLLQLRVRGPRGLVPSSTRNSNFWRSRRRRTVSSRSSPAAVASRTLISSRTQSSIRAFSSVSEGGRCHVLA